MSAANPVQADQGDWVGYGALRYLSDVHGFGGPTVASAQMHAIFMQQEGNECRISVCWGDPEGFLRDLAHSDFIHVADQYVNNTSNKPLHCRAGLPVDSANDLLSHETFETIADPDVDGWWNYDSVYLIGAEIGDECESLVDPPVWGPLA